MEQQLNVALRQTERARRPRGALVRPVSSIFFSLTDRRAFEEAIRQTVAWLVNRCHGKLPPESFDGAPFDLIEQPEANPTSAVLVQTKTARIWSARLSFPDRNIPQRTWITEVTVSQNLGEVDFGARLISVTKGPDSPYTPSVPGMVRQLLSTLSGEVDNVPLRDEIWIIENDAGLSDFSNLLLSPDRRLPIVAFSRGEFQHLVEVQNETLSRLIGAAHVVELSEESSWALTNTLGKVWSVFGGAIRIYWPKLNPSIDNPRSHRLIFSHLFDDAKDTANFLAEEILPRTVVSAETRLGLPRFDVVRAAFAAQARQRDAEAGATEASQINALKLEVDRLSAQLEEDGAAAEELLAEAANARLITQQDRDTAWAEVARLRARVSVVEYALKKTGQQTADDRLSNYDDFERWSGEQLAGHVVILPRAYSEIKKHHSDETLDKISKTLLLLRDSYVPMRRGSLEIQRADFDAECQNLGIRESACFSNRKDAKGFPEYYLRRRFTSHTQTLGVDVWSASAITFGGILVRLTVSGPKWPRCVLTLPKIGC